jgi:hypothetical protein
MKYVAVDPILSEQYDSLKSYQLECVKNDTASKNKVAEIAGSVKEGLKLINNAFFPGSGGAIDLGSMLVNKSSGIPSAAVKSSWDSIGGGAAAIASGGPAAMGAFGGGAASIAQNAAAFGGAAGGIFSSGPAALGALGGGAASISQGAAALGAIGGGASVAQGAAALGSLGAAAALMGR